MSDAVGIEILDLSDELQDTIEQSSEVAFFAEELSVPSPCDGCHNCQRCGNRLLACRAFFTYVHEGVVRDCPDLFMPSRAMYRMCFEQKRKDN